jgi:hypothetical protein
LRKTGRLVPRWWMRLREQRAGSVCLPVHVRHVSLSWLLLLMRLLPLLL